MRKILWADDEIDLLRSHILFLQDRGYTVTPVTNGEDAISRIQREHFDIVLLDEMMTGKDGLTTLEEIKSWRPDLPVVMITKNEEEKLMEDAIGRQIDSYLTKPVNPSQILMACKQILDRRHITGQKLAQDYIRDFNDISRRISEPLGYADWFDIHASLCQWDIELSEYFDLGLRQTLEDQKRSCNVEFGRFVEKNYHKWLHDRGDGSPRLSVDVFSRFVFPKIAAKRPVVLFVIDCLRLDQWMGFETVLRDLFDISREYYYSILPTATPYSRNAIFAGLFPIEIERQFPDIWSTGEEDDTSRNRFEKELMEHQLKMHRVPLTREPRYVKILTQEHARTLDQNILSYVESTPLTAIVINFLDILAHSRSDSHVIKEIAPDEAAYRSLSQSWFTHSSLLETFRKLAKLDCTVIITSDHGSIRSLHGTQVVGDREASTALRYKYGRNLKVNAKHALTIKNPADYKLPARSVNTSYIIAKEDFYFVYPTNYHHYLSHYKDTFQHGGMSMDEMIMPVIEMTGR